MTFKFPTSGTTLSVPPVGATFGVGTKIWTWDGSVFFRSDLGQRGATGATGAAITSVKVEDDGKLSISLDTGATVDAGDVVKPAGFKYLINVNPGTTGVALFGAQGATSNILFFNNSDLDGNDTENFFTEIANSPRNTTLTIKSLVGATQVSLKVDGVTGISGTNFRQVTGVSGSGFTSPFTIGKVVFLFKETTGKTGAGITNPKITTDGRLTFDTIDGDGATTAVINVGEVRGATGIDGQTPLAAVDTTAWLTFPSTFALAGIPGIGGLNKDIIKESGVFHARFNGRSGNSGDFVAVPSGVTARANLAAESFADILKTGTQIDLVKTHVNDVNFPTITGGSSFGNDQSFSRVILTTDAITGPGASGFPHFFGFTATVSITGTRDAGETFGSRFGVTSDQSSYIRIKNIVPPKGASGADGVNGVTGASGAGFTAPVLNADGTLSLTTITNLGAESVVNIGTVRGATGITGVTGSGVVGITFSTTTATAESQIGGVTANDITLTFGFTFGLSTPQPSGDPILTVFRPATTSSTFRVLNGASGQASTNTNPTTNPLKGGIFGNTPQTELDPIVESLNTIAFGDLAQRNLIGGGGSRVKGTTQSNGTILAIRDFQNTGGAGASGSDVLIRAKQGLKLGRVDLGGSNFSDMQIRLLNGSTTDTGTVMNITPDEFRFSAGASNDLFGIHKDQGFGVSVKTVPLFTHSQHQALSGISLGAGITFSNSTHQASAAADVASFTITSSSAISTGAKTNALYRVPYLCEFTNFDIRTNKTGGITLSLRLSSDPGSPTTGESIPTTLHASGLTASTASFQQGGSIAGKFLHLNVVANAAGATNAQAFLSFKPAKELAGD